MNILYRIHTEDRDNLATIANQYFPGFTILSGVGFYQSLAEPAAVIELYGAESDREEVERLARAIATVNEQQSVIVAEFGPNGIGITEHGPREVSFGENLMEEPGNNVIDFPVRRAA